MSKRAPSTSKLARPKPVMLRITSSSGCSANGCGPRHRAEVRARKRGLPSAAAIAAGNARSNSGDSRSQCPPFATTIPAAALAITAASRNVAPARNASVRCRDRGVSGALHVEDLAPRRAHALAGPDPRRRRSQSFAAAGDREIAATDTPTQPLGHLADVASSQTRRPASASASRRLGFTATPRGRAEGCAWDPLRRTGRRPKAAHRGPRSLARHQRALAVVLEHDAIDARDGGGDRCE